MDTLYSILYAVAIVCFVIAAFAADKVPARVHLVALGLLAWVLVPAIMHFDAVMD